MDKLPEIAENLAATQEMIKHELHESQQAALPESALTHVVSVPDSSPIDHVVLSRLEAVERTLLDGFAEMRGYIHELGQDVSKPVEQTIDTAEDEASDVLDVPMELIEPEPATEETRKEKKVKKRSL